MYDLYTILNIDTCQNGGICVNTIGSYSCNCPPEYTEIDCSSMINCSNTSCPDPLVCVEVLDPEVGFECRNSTNITVDLVDESGVDMAMNVLQGEQNVSYIY